MLHLSSDKHQSAARRQSASKKRKCIPWHEGDRIKVTKDGTQKGKEGTVTDSDWKGQVKVIMDGTKAVKSYSPTELKKGAKEKSASLLVQDDSIYYTLINMGWGKTGVQDTSLIKKLIASLLSIMLPLGLCLVTICVSLSLISPVCGYHSHCPTHMYCVNLTALENDASRWRRPRFAPSSVGIVANSNCVPCQFNQSSWPAVVARNQPFYESPMEKAAHCSEAPASGCGLVTWNIMQMTRMAYMVLFFMALVVAVACYSERCQALDSMYMAQSKLKARNNTQIDRFLCETVFFFTHRVLRDKCLITCVICIFHCLCCFSNNGTTGVIILYNGLGVSFLLEADTILLNGLGLSGADDDDDQLVRTCSLHLLTALTLGPSSLPFLPPVDLRRRGELPQDPGIEPCSFPCTLFTLLHSPTPSLLHSLPPAPSPALPPANSY
jgi:hypothetical protein